MTFRSSLTALCLLATTAVLAQADAPFQCGNGDVRNYGVDMNDPVVVEAIQQATEALESHTRQFIAEGERGGGGGYVIPLVFHIIHNNGPENISDAQIRDAVRVVNEDFNRMNSDWDNVRSDFQDRVADVGVEFRLATRDPNGQCTNGITRTESALTNDGGSTMRALIQWPRSRYVNVWVAASANGAAGYTNLPAVADFNPSGDGIVLQHTYTGSIGTSSVNRSRTLTHELGHFFNLRHTWGAGNNPALSSNCDQDDNVDDTPNTIGWTSCNLGGSSCGSLDNVENFMDYSYCSKMFTDGQGARMIAALNSGTAQRNQLWQTNNLINTGTNGNATLCVADFSYDRRVICAGSSVQFTDESYHNVSIRNWSFPGGEPSTSNEANPTVTYPEGGVYAVSLTVSDGSGNLSTTLDELVVVASDPGQEAPLVEGFEDINSFTDIGWTTGSLSTSGFALTSAAAYSGSKSARVLNSADNDGSIVNLYAPTVNLDDVSSIDLSFRYAFAQRNLTNNDRLRVYVSNNCGDSWSLRTQLQGVSDLTTAGVRTGSFVPNGQDQWGLVEITNITSGFYVPDFRLRFEFESDGGNNLYIDDVNISGIIVGLEEVLSGSGSRLTVVPNPASDNAQAVLNVSGSGKVRVELMDVVGRTVVGLHDGDLPQGVRRFDLPVNGLPAGLYFVRMQQDGFSETVRFVVE